MAAPTIGKWYRLTNAYTGAGLALDVVNDAGTSSSGTLQMASAGAFSGQYWQLEYNPASSTSTYALFTQFLGETKRLDVYGDDATKPHLAAGGSYSGQIWTIAAWGDGTFRLSNAFSGSNMFLDVYSDTQIPFLEAAEHSGQHWTFTPLDGQAAAAPSPGATTHVPSTVTSSGASNTSLPNSPPQPAASDHSSPSGAAIIGSSKKSSVNAGAIAGGVIGGLAVLGILVALAFYLRRRRNRAAGVTTNHDPPTSPVSKETYQHNGQDGLASTYQAPVLNNGDGGYFGSRG
ncbi:hypothetical protein CPB83DRAFT_864200 [Crepidotus variabilis]|uniref:Ricin B lectin domain-containing protein n=1 Tax=Crepidotus variabilis TaxID=179855 RepID=A0A9P6JJ42_9AGAR|nr:hypothetical protein CPB83DRAFT_864200 [Crepidotus variabilis]